MRRIATGKVTLENNSMCNSALVKNLYCVPCDPK